MVTAKLLFRHLHNYIYPQRLITRSLSYKHTGFGKLYATTTYLQIDIVKQIINKQFKNINISYY